MSDVGEHDLAPRKSSSDMFDDDEVMGGLLKSLISAKGLQSQWQIIGRRLQAAEKALRELQQRIGEFPAAYVARDEYHELVEVRHAEQLAEHEGMCNRVEEMASRIEKIVMEEQVPQVQSCLEMCEANKKDQAQLNAIVAEMREHGDSLHGEVLVSIQAFRDEVSEHNGQNSKDHAHLQEQIQRMAVEIPEVERRMQDFTTDAIQKMAADLLHFEVDDAVGLTDKQEQLLEFIRKALINQVYADLGKSNERTAEVARDVSRHRDELSRQIRAAEKTVGNLNTRMKQSLLELRDDVESRTKRTEATAAETALATSIANVSSVLRALQTKVVVKLDEFVDHFAKLHVTIDDHEHCLRHHAEEIENRSTKYDLLVCQNQIDKCGMKDDIMRETAEIRKVVNWQSSKIGTFGLTNQSGAASRRRKKHRSSINWSASRDTITTLSDDGSGSRSVLTPLGEDAESATASRLLLPRDDENGGWTDDAEGFEDDEDDEYADANDSTPSSELVRQQLESVSMGLVGLGHLLLKEPRLGTSRNARLAQEKELLEELQNLRHWISNRMAPAGWNPAKLTTVALKCSHPREDEVKGPLPQVSLKRALVGTPDDNMSGTSGRPTSGRPTRLPSTEPPDGAKIAPLATSRSLTKLPLSARGERSAANSLPPLQLGPPLQVA
mmetsp:Transcript_75733/g.214063  ORF Transcript_75733/g.214063 Transcript_75733/m.214063 type:complete len:667 (-) Transcript_75733:70-2070(-)